MPSITVTVGSADGLHARPAGIIAEFAEGLGSWIELSVAEAGSADAASAMMIMALGAEKGSPVTVSGDDASAVRAVAELVARDLDAE